MNTNINDSTINRATNPGAVVGAAQSQWFRRPEDHKFESLDTLFAAVHGRRMRSHEHRASTDGFQLVGPVADADGRARGFHVVSKVLPPSGSKAKSTEMIVRPTHYAFGQLCSTIGAPAGYFRDKLADRPDVVIEAVNHGMKRKADAGEDVKLLAVDPKDPNSTDVASLYALTSPTYGRIWDADVVTAAQKIVARTDGEFYAPLDWGKKKRALFASDRDVFMFFINGGSIVDGGGDRDQLNRGFFIWNSEVGSKTFGIATFLFRQVCGNFGIWGAEDVRLLKIRHTSGGPERFVTEAVPALQEYTRMTAKPIELAVRKAKTLELPSEDAEFYSWFRKRGFNNAETRRARDLADAEEGSHHRLWDMYNGFTACARTMAYAEAKVDLETRAGKLMEALVEAA